MADFMFPNMAYRATVYRTGNLSLALISSVSQQLILRKRQKQETKRYSEKDKNKRQNAQSTDISRKQNL